MKKPTNAEQQSLRAYAGLIFGLASSLTYMVERLYERLRAGKAAPQLVIAEAHATFYWRATLAAWFGLVIALLVYRTMATVTPQATQRLTIALLLLPIATLWTVRFP